MLSVLDKLQLYMDYSEYEDCDYIATYEGCDNIYFGRAITIGEFIYYVENKILKTKVIGEKSEYWYTLINQLPHDTRKLKKGYIYLYTGSFQWNTSSSI